MKAGEPSRIVQSEDAGDIFRMLLEFAPDPTIVVRGDQSITLVNQQAERLFGYEREEMLGQPLEILLPERYCHTHAGHFTDYFANPEFRAMSSGLELYAVKKDGSEFPVEISLRPLTTDDGLLISSTIRDVSDHINAKKKIEQLNSELEIRVDERTRELGIANQELEAFAYSVSHDLRAPLRIINGYVEALLEDMGKELDGASRNYLDRIAAGIRRMGQLIDDMLKLARLSRGELDRKSTDLSQIAAVIALELESSAPDRGVEFRIAEGAIVNCDERLMSIVLQNLIGNAWKFTVGRDAAVIEFGSVGQDGGTVYYIRDNGAGFNMAYSDKLFTAFQRLHRAEDFEGTGIGLATVKRVMDRHGGHVWAESVEGQGTTIFFQS